MTKVMAHEIREKFLTFFRSKQHTIIPSASLIPENDPTVLFTTAGMHPLVPFLLGEKHPGGTRLTDVQKCIRTGDIDEVGDATHLTFFEMLGNWSLGDYFKKEAIEYSFEFLTSKEWLGLDKKFLAVSVFEGDNDAPFDEEAFAIWKSLGISEKRIAKLPKKNNWWGPAGETGPCGPDTEMFYWTGKPEEVPDSFNDDNPLWVEIWNDVFMQYNKRADGTFEPLKQKNVDTGMGLERTVAVLNKIDVYQIDIFEPIIQKIEELTRKSEEEYGRKYGENEQDTRAMRIIADHIRAAVFILGDERGVVPDNVGQGYVLRRLIRRAIRYGKIIGIIEPHFTSKIAEKVIDVFKEPYKELGENRDFIIDELVEEESKFKTTIEKGLKILHRGRNGMQALRIAELSQDKIPDLSNLHGGGFPNFIPQQLSGKWFFDLYQSFGFPLEMALEELKNDEQLRLPYQRDKIEKDFKKELEKHQELSRTASAGQFKGGLADHSEVSTKYHTATHLLHQALIDVLHIPAGQK
ncbi:MAG: alanine--tRNA ligase, partial [Candidatus Paceibacterota bacterium]